jgi:hypothetical protein
MVEEQFLLNRTFHDDCLKQPVLEILSAQPIKLNTEIYYYGNYRT